MIDVDIDVRDDAGDGDPDTTSVILRKYHQLLWSKSLPNGTMFRLDAPPSRGYFYLHHLSELGELRFGSDTVVPTFRSWTRKAIREVVEQIPAAELDEFQRWNHTIGGMMIFPKGVDGVKSLNGARGTTSEIADRFDLTLECIRLQYAGEENPLSKPLVAYWDFFSLFGSFEGYVEFFLLEDLAAPDGLVRFFLSFDKFGVNTLPQSVDEYRTYRDNAVTFLKARNRRIDSWAKRNLAA